MTFEDAERLLRYEPDTGKIFWKDRPESMFKTRLSFLMWSSRFPGKEAFCCDDGLGYMAGEIFGKRYLAHRVAWLLATGGWPSGDIDHIDGDGKNNRLSNLRDVPHQINSRNQKIRKNNTSGETGVYARRSGKWLAAVKVDGRFITIGTYKTKEDAAAARREANEKIGFTERHGT
jgi:hypothetical protein